MLEESLSPLTDNILGGVYPAGCQQDHLGSNDIEIRHRLFGRLAIELCGLLRRLLIVNGTFPWHQWHRLSRRYHDAHSRQTYRQIRSYVYEDPTNVGAA